MGQRQSQTPFSSAFWVQKDFRSKKRVGSKKVLIPKNFFCPVINWPVITWPVLTCPVLTWPDLTCPDFTCPDLTCLDFICPELTLTWRVLTCPVLTWPVLTWPVLTWPVQTWPVLTSPVLTYQNTIQTSHRFPPDTLKTPSRHPLDSQRHLPDTRQTLSRQFPNTLQTPTRQSLKIRHVGSFLLLKARWGLFFFFLPSSFFLPVGKQSQLLLQPTEVELGFSSRSGVWQKTKTFLTPDTSIK